MSESKAIIIALNRGVKVSSTRMRSNSMDGGDAVSECINDVLSDDVLRLIVQRVESEDDNKALGLVCKRWLRLHNTETKKLTVRARGSHVLPRMAERFTRLLELDLSFSPYITDSDLAFIANAFPCLSLLNLCRCGDITDVGIIAIGESLPLLQSLYVSGTFVTDKGLSAIAKGCHDLRILHTGNVSDVALEVLSENCPNLEELDLGWTSITDYGLVKLASGCRQIRFLDLVKCGNVSDVGVSSICRACSSSLKILKLTDCYKIGDETILTLTEFCCNLETLTIGGNDVSDVAIKSLATACGSSLKILDLDWCQNISDSTVSCILSQCRNLEALGIAACIELTDAAFQVISNEKEHGLSLKILNVGHCPNITLAGIGIIVAKCPFLEYLDVTSCKHITEAGLHEADFHFPECCEIDFDSGVSQHPVFC